MSSKQEQRSEETRRLILAAAEKLFVMRGYDAVTMREIAKEARCSHTTIYIYFADKTALLHQLSMPHLRELVHELEGWRGDDLSDPVHQLAHMSHAFIAFCLTHRNIHAILFDVETSRVDEAEPALEIQRLRNHVFGLLRAALHRCFPDLDDAFLWRYARIYYFMIRGILETYIHSNEPGQGLLNRLSSTFDTAAEVLLLGFQHKLREGDGGK